MDIGKISFSPEWRPGTGFAPTMDGSKIYFLPPYVPPTAPPVVTEYPKTTSIPSLTVSDAVNHPKHYTSHPSGVECIQITEHYNFCVGNAIKYLWRAGLKSDADKDPVEKEIEDCKKAIWYIQRQIANLSKTLKK